MDYMASNHPIRTGASHSDAFEVGRWFVDPATDLIMLDGKVVKLEPRMMRLLQVLASRPGQVVGTEELLDAVWPGLVVTNQSLYQAVGALRAVLKADSETGVFVANVPRKGYRLVAPVSHFAQLNAVPKDRSAREAALFIAVLAFQDLGLSADLAFLRETLMSDLILELSRQPNLSPIARGTMSSYLGKVVVPHQVASDLGVRYVLDGTLAQRDNDLHVTCELVDASNKSVLASETITWPATQWPLAARQVVGRMARAARLQVTEHAASESERSDPGSRTALAQAMGAWVELYCRPQSRETNDRAWQLAADALRLDEGIAAAWNALAYCEWRASQFGWSDLDHARLLSDAVNHARRATALAPSDPDAHYTLGLATYTAGELESSEASLRHCLTISTSYAPAFGLLGLVRAVRGFPGETADLCEQALTLSPREPLRAVWHWTEACALSMLGHDAQAYEKACLGIAANPDFPSCYLAAAVSAYRIGKPDAAARYVTVLRSTAFNTIEQLRKKVRALQAEPWATAFLADLQRAGIPAH